MIVHRSRRSSTRRNTPPPLPATTLLPPHNTHLLLIITTATTIVVAIRRLTLMGMSTVVSMAQPPTFHPITVTLHNIMATLHHLTMATLHTTLKRTTAKEADIMDTTLHRHITATLHTTIRRQEAIPTSIHHHTIMATLHPTTHLHLITTASTHLRHPTIQTRQLQQVAATIIIRRLTTAAMATRHKRRLSVPLAAEASEERAATSMAMMEAIDSHGWCGRQTRTA